MITLEKFNKFKPGDVFLAGVAFNEPGDLYMIDSMVGSRLLWVAVKGTGDDRAIYTHFEAEMPTFFHVLEYGDKVTDKGHIRSLVNCDDEVFARYN